MTDVYYNKGRLIAAVEATLIFARTPDASWMDSSVVPGTSVPVQEVCEVTSFVADIVDSAYMDLVGATFSQPQQPIKRGMFVGAFFVDVPPAPSSHGLGPDDILDSDLRNSILAAITSGTLPVPNENTVYIVMAPGEVLWADGLTGTKAGGGGYHDQIGVSSILAVPYCVIGTASRENGDGPPITHELVEAITDADLNGWRDQDSDPEKEVCDLCFPNTTQFHGQDVSLFWSPIHEKCVGPVDDATKKAGASVEIVGGPGYCAGGVVIGSTFTLSATATFLNGPEDIASYLWGSTNGATVPRAADAEPTVEAPENPGPFSIDLSVITAHGCLAGATRKFMAVTEEESTWLMKLCQLMQQLPRRPPIYANPLWDPLRDLAVYPLSDSEIAKMRELSNRISEVVDHLENPVREKELGISDK